MIWNERVIVTAISRQVLQRKCLLLVDNSSWPGSECDVLGVTTDLRIIDVEVKISRADLKADANKDKWWQTYWPWGREAEHRCMPAPNMLPQRVWKHYYAMPEAIWKDNLLEALPSPASGVILLREAHHASIAIARVARRCKPNKEAYRLKPEQVMDIARLQNLRMWDAYETIERQAADCRAILAGSKVAA